MSPRSAGEAGSAVVDFVLVGLLTTVLFLGVLQLALALHVRATLVDCAAEGARYGALADRTPEAGARRADELIEMTLPGYPTQVAATTVEQDGLTFVAVEVTAPLPVVGLLGPHGSLTVVGHAFAEES